MNTLRTLVHRTLTATCATLVAMSTPALASAAPVSEKDYVLFSTSLRDRANGEKRFKQVLLVSYGDRNLGKTYFGKRGPVPSQRISLVSEAGSITFRGTGNKGVSSLEVNGEARPGKDLMVVLVNGARCRVGNQKPEPCQAEIRVIRGKDGLSDRIVASGSNGAAYDSGAKDGMSSSLNLPAME